MTVESLMNMMGQPRCLKYSLHCYWPQPNTGPTPLEFMWSESPLLGIVAAALIDG